MRRNKNKAKAKTHNLIFLYIITTIIVTALSLSKYMSTVSTDSITRVALMAETVNINVDLSEGVYPGYTTILPIEITNKENNKICEVAQSFIISIGETNTDIPLEFMIYKDVNCTEIIEKDENGNFSSDYCELKAGEEDTKTLYLKINWPEEQKSEDLAFEIGYFTLDIISSQID